MKEYSKESLKSWENREIGSGEHRGKVFVIYDTFPDPSLLEHPKHIPLDVKWARFRMEQSFRLGGFIVPEELHGKIHEETGFIFDKNTFYVVFIDRDHNFYLTGK